MLNESQAVNDRLCLVRLGKLTITESVGEEHARGLSSDQGLHRALKKETQSFLSVWRIGENEMAALLQ